jgi:ring-1,2-phenylacetyl-CoA epoxidase subunit PaaD
LAVTDSWDSTAVWAALEAVHDPEIPVLSIVDLGIVRDVRVDADRCEVLVTPTYAGCPATAVIEREIRTALDRAGYPRARITTALAPPWSTDDLSERGREQLRAYGIAPPAHPARSPRALFGPPTVIECPRCGAPDTERVSEFGSTPCKAHYRCRACLEPFDYFKCL